MFNNLYKRFPSKDQNLILKIRMASVLSFAVGTLNKNVTDRLEASETLSYRRILGISCIDKVSNIEVMRKMQKKKEIINTVEIRRLEYLGHIMREWTLFNLPHVIIQVKELEENWFNCSSTYLLRVCIVMLTSKLLTEDGTWRRRKSPWFLKGCVLGDVS